LKVPLINLYTNNNNKIVSSKKFLDIWTLQPTLYFP